MIDKAYAIAFMLLLAPAAIATTDQGQDFLENFDRTEVDSMYDADGNIIEDIAEENLDDDLVRDKNTITDSSKLSNDKNTDMECITVGDLKERWHKYADRGGYDKDKERENDRDEDREQDEDEREDDDESDEEETDEEEDNDSDEDDNVEE